MVVRDSCRVQIDMAKKGRGRTIDDYLDDSMSDPLSEQVYDVVDSQPSKTAFRLGRYLVNQGVADPAVKLVVEGFDEKYFNSRKHRDRAAKFLRQWVRFSHDDLSDISVARGQLSALLKDVEGLTKSFGLFDKVMSLIQENFSFPTAALYDDLASLGEKSIHYSELPFSVREIFLKSVDRAMERNRRIPGDNRRRYSHLGDILESLSGFTGPHNNDLHEVVRTISRKDTRHILFPLYERLSSLPEHVPDIVVYAIAKAADFIPPDSAMLDFDVQRFAEFVYTVSDAFDVHSLDEMECFFDLYRRLVKNTENWRIFQDMKYMLDASCAIRRDRKFKDEIDLSAELDRLRFLGLKYLLLSDELDQEGTEDIDYFASRIIAMNRESIQEAFEQIKVYEAVMLESEHEVLDTDDRFYTLKIRADRTQDILAEMDRNRIEILKKGPIACPLHLRKHMIETFADVLDGDVEYIWDLRPSQEFLYMSRGSAKTFIELTRLKTDLLFLDKIVYRLDKDGLLDHELTVVGGGCGPASAEIEFSKILGRHGYDVELVLVDKSLEMIDEAGMNCAADGIEATILHKKLEELSLEDVALGRQVCLTFWGGTWFNLLHSRELADLYYRMFEGLHVVESFDHHGCGVGNLPLMLIEGDTKKNRVYYENRLSKLFLARGIGTNYHLPMESLMHEGRLCHTTFYNDDDYALQSLYLVTRNSGPFRKNHVIWVIDSNTMHAEVFSRLMGYSGFDAGFIEGKDNRAAAICTPRIKRLKR